jgi:hypothetical protein
MPLNGQPMNSWGSSDFHIGQSSLVKCVQHGVRLKREIKAKHYFRERTLVITCKFSSKTTFSNTSTYLGVCNTQSVNNKWLLAQCPKGKTSRKE